MAKQRNQSLSYIGRGRISMRALIDGTPTAHKNIGNCSQLDLNFAEERAEQRDYRVAGGGNAALLTRVSSMTGSITTFSFNSAVMAAVMRSQIITQAAGEDISVTYKVVADCLDAFIPLKVLPDKAEPITLEIAGTALTLNTDYSITNTGIQLINGGNHAADDDITITYKSVASFSINPLTEGQVNYEIVFDGLNEANTNKPVAICVRCAALNLVQTINIISGDTDFGTLPFTFEALRDETVVEDGISQFASIQMAA